MEIYLTYWVASSFDEIAYEVYFRLFSFEINDQNVI